MIDYEKWRRALKRLELQYINYAETGTRPELTPIDREAVAESVIQRFETAYDVLWKCLKRYLIDELGLVDVPNSPKPVIRLAGENNLLPASVEVWLRYADARTATAHDYSGTKAEETLALAPAFLDDAVRLYRVLSGRDWQ